MAQIEVSLSHGDREVKKTVLVRKDAPNDLLISTDIQPRLGFSLVVTGPNGKATDLFDRGEVTMNCNMVTSSMQEQDVPDTAPVAVKAEENRGMTPQVEQEVRLLQAVQIPAGHQKMVRGKVDMEPTEVPLMFTPGGLKGTLRLADSLVQMDKDKDSSGAEPRD